MADEKKSIFDLADKLGYKSLFNDWEREDFISKISGESTDFLPIVNLNFGYQGINCVIPTKKDCIQNVKTLNLSTDFDSDKRKYKIYEVIIAKNSPSYIPLVNLLGYDPTGFQDGDGKLHFYSSKSSKIKLLNSSNPAIAKDNLDPYDLNDAEIGDEYVLKISHSLQRGTVFYVGIYASDDDDGWLGTKSQKVVRCGQINFKVVEKDVFFLEEVNKGINEILLIAGKYKGRPKKGEYSVNYCIQAADRFLGAVVENKKNFYAYDDESDQRINIPLLDNAINRAKRIKELGYGYDFKEIGGSIFTIREENKEDKYENNPTRTLSLKPNNEINTYFKNIVGFKAGYHIFYLSIVDGFHTLIIVVNNVDLCNPTYEIYDEEGLSSSTGKLSDIADGILKQTQWVYLWAKPRYGYWAKLTVSILKFQRK